MSIGPLPIPPRTVRSVIFDMDGVIVDSHPAHRRAWQSFLETIGKKVSDRDLDFILEGRKRGEILRHFLGEVSPAQLDEYGRQKDLFFQRIALEVKPVPGVVDFILHLHQQGVTLGMATSASRARALSTLKRLRLSECFAAVATGEDVVRGKPDPAVYQLVCHRLGSEPTQCVAVEDSVSGVQSAKAAGLACIGVAANGTGDQLRAAGADRVIEDFVGLSLEDLKSLLERQPAPVGQ